MKTFNLTKVIFLLFSFFSSSVTPLNAAEVQSLDEELSSMDIHEEVAYPYIENSNQDVSTLLFLENDDEYYIYFYMPKGIVQYDFFKIQLGIYVSDQFDELNNDSNLEINNFNLEYIDTTNNGCVAKYAILDMEETLYTYDHRRYSIRQVYMRYDNVFNPPGTIRSIYFPYWQTLGDEYYYYQDIDGKTVYHYKKAEYVSLRNKVSYSYMFEKTPWYDFIHPGYEEGKEYFFYGFTPDRDIDHLKEVEIIYNYQTIQGIKADYFSKPYFASDKSTPTLGEEKRENRIILEGIEQTTTSHAFFLPNTISWETISTPEELSQNADSYFSEFMEEYFAGYEYVVTFADYSYKLDDKYLITHTTDEENAEFIDYLMANRNDYIIDGTSFVSQYYAYNGTYVSDISIVRMRYETDGLEYNIQVITDPVDVSGTGSGSDTVSIFDKIEELIEDLKDQLGAFWEILKIIVCVLIAVLIAFILFKILKFIWNGIQSIFGKDK